MSIRRALPVLASVMLACAAPPQVDGAGAGAAPDPISEHAWVIFGSDTIRAEVARTEAQRERGLMLRETLPEGSGMLFVFPEAEVQGVWMKDTDIALDAAFIDEAFTVLGIEPLEPRDLTVKYSEAPIMYVLEVPRGWFADHGVTPGDRATIVFGTR